jgi:hypothetical protein
MNKYQKGGTLKKTAKKIDVSKAKPVPLKKPTGTPKTNDPGFSKITSKIPKINDPGFKMKEPTGVKPYKKGGSIKKK